MPHQQIREVIRPIDLCLLRVPVEEPPTDPDDEAFRQSR